MIRIHYGLLWDNDIVDLTNTAMYGTCVQVIAFSQRVLIVITERQSLPHAARVAFLPRTRSPDATAPRAAALLRPQAQTRYPYRRNSIALTLAS